MKMRRFVTWAAFKSDDIFCVDRGANRRNEEAPLLRMSTGFSE